VPGRQNELLPIGPVTVRLRKEPGAGNSAEVSLRVSGRKVAAKSEGNELVIEVGDVLDHEVVVVDWSR
jgi:hypothetical protein